tara:strand:+ start:545 stop:850 length:306 start_codon:yes stop_codon:yes gene_type:complete
MKLTELTAEPKLIEILLDDKDTVKEFGESLSFHTWDRQPMDVFMKLANVNSADGQDTVAMVEIVKTMILDEDGNAIMTGNTVLPVHVLLKVITKITEMLGK